MKVILGQRIPDVYVGHLDEAGSPVSISLRGILDQGTHIVIGVPGAFTPTCSSTHLPRYEELYDAFKAQGIDEVICLSVNDAFVMFKWGKEQNNKNVFLLPDGNGEFTRKMGMLVDKSNIGFGMRSWRYSMIVDDMNVEKMFIEEGFEDNCGSDPFEVSDADTLLAYLKGSSSEGVSAPRKAFEG